MRSWLRALALGLALIPVTAVSDAPPEVVLAIPGTAGSNGGAVERFTMRFSEAMVPLGDPRATPPSKLECAVGATARWVDPQTFVYDFEHALPGGMTCTVSLRPNLASARGVAVRNTGQQFTIDTGGPSARAVMPGAYGGDIEEDQVFLVATNTPPTNGSVSANAYCAVDGIGEKIAVDVQPAATTATIVDGLGKDNWNLRNFLESAGLPQTVPANAEDKAKMLSSVVAVKCRRPLPPGRDMALVWDAGIASADGRTAGRVQRFDFTVRKAFSARWECSRVNPQAGCNPVQDAHIRFTAPIPAEQAKAIRLTFADGTTRTPTFDDDDKNKAAVADINFKGPFPEATTGTVTLPAGVKDESGRVLENAARFPLQVNIDRAPPLVKFAAPFGILEAKEGGMLPVTVRAVEPGLAQRTVAVSGASLKVDGSDGQVADWLRRIDKADGSDYREEGPKDNTHTVNYTGSASLLEGQGTGLKLGLPGAGKQFEVVGVPLTKPGFYVVELASPALGQALLGRNATRYVAAGALVTNMAVHFKWGRESSLAWVTALDSGKAVAGADVRVTDSCTGEQLARGTSDGQGRLLITGGLPDPSTSGSCEEGASAHPLMVSARAGDDFSFTLTDWGEGIRPYDFDLPYGWSERGEILHTVFDRTLIRAGETVNMKHILRKPVGAGFAFTDGLEGTLRLSHRGSETQFEMPITIGKDGIGENSWTAPQGAPMGDYDLSVEVGDRTIYTNQSVRVDEFRLPTMRATIAGPKETLVKPKLVPLDLFVGYLSGGGAANLPVAIRTAFSTSEESPDGWDGWTFGGDMVTEGTTPLDGEGNAPEKPVPLSQTLPVTLNASGTAQTNIEINQPVDTRTTMTVEMDYQDANGETLTASRNVVLNPSAVRLGMKTDGWLMRDNDLRLKLVAIKPDGSVLKGQPVSVELYTREVITARRRLIGGFYAYDNQAKVTRIAGTCSISTDAQGLADCKINPGVSGEVIAVATTKDADGNVARAVRTVWLAGEDEWWFGGDNGDRMDLVAEAREYKAGETAKFQVRMPFRSATALVTVEREGVLSSFVTELSGKDPVVSVPMPGAYAPDVYVSVMAVRGRIGGWSLWWADLARKWHLPFLSREGSEPTALVDLAKPSYRIGIAKVKVGWEAHTLGVKVSADKTKYAVRENANVEVAVTDPSGKPARSAEIAFAAVDEALLQLQPNESWKLIDAMMGERTLDVVTSTAQTQVVGKRHYGKKAVEAGGGGGGDMSAVNREDFRPMLLWKGRVPLDANGHARIAVPLSDSLSSFKLVAIATDGAQLFGTGETAVRTTQDLQLFSALPPLVRTGDFYGASFTLRNSSDRPMKVTATVKVNPEVANGQPLTVEIPAGGAVPVTWNLTAPEGAGKLVWSVEAKSEDGKAVDRLTTSQDVVPAVPFEVWAATLTRVGAGSGTPIVPPAGALPGSYVDIKLSDTLAPPLGGVRAYMAAYPFNCFEQQLSRAVVLGDAGSWGALAGSIPTYMDSDGLLKYFPSDSMQGSEALTAYAMSMTAEAGFAVPEASKAKMIEALKAVVEGRLKREVTGPSDFRLLKVSALAALARNGASTPALLGAIDIAPADMPTALLADWMTAIDRTPGLKDAPARRALAERTLRQRIVYEGSRIDLTDATNMPWWMMVSYDETVLKALNAILGRPGWQNEGPKLMVGMAGRQVRGHWDTTPANAWGTIAARRFAALYPASAITGTTTLALGSVTKTQAWPMAADAGPIRLPVPAASTPLMMTQAGGAGPWATVQVSAAVPLRQALFAGYRMTKQTGMLIQKNKGRYTRGDVMKVVITVEASAERSWVVISDPVPPGGTIIGGLGGQSQILAGQGNASGGGGQVGILDAQGKPLIVEYGVQPGYVERGRDAWRAYFAWVPAGKFTVSYAVRLNGTGRFSLPPSRVEAMYSPDIRAQVPNAGIEVGM